MYDTGSLAHSKRPRPLLFFFCGSYVKMNVDMSTESNIQSLMLINPYKTQQEHLKNRHAYVVTLGCIMNNWL